MTTRRGEDDPKGNHSPDPAASADRPARLLTSEDIFGDMLDPAEASSKPPGAAVKPGARKRPIKVQVSEPGAQRKEGPASPLASGEELPDDVAALLDAFAEPAEPAKADDAEPSEVGTGGADGADAESADQEDDALLHEILTEGPPDPAMDAMEMEGEDVFSADRLIEDVSFGIEADAQPADSEDAEPLAGGLVEEETEKPDAPAVAAATPDPADAEALRDFLELQPRRSILHPLDALGEAPRPASRTGTKFQAAAPKPVAEQGPGVDLAGVAADALEKPRPAQVEAPPSSPRVPVGGSPYGPYRLLERVAMGGMAEVFKAKRTGVEGFEKVLAVKRILPHLSDNKEFVDMFIDEAKMVAGLAHPNIVQIFDLGKIDKSYYIAMEYVHGRDLRSILRRARELEIRMPLDLSLLVVSRVCSALEFAHRKKDERGRAMMIVHRDISPQNILISFEGDVKLTDFGIAKAATKASITDAGALRGKLLYMSPEQAWGKAMDRRSDIFSLGIVFYEMVTDHRPFLGSSEMSILEMVRECNVASPSTLNPRIPEKLESAIMRSLARDPEDRYQDAAEMYRDLERVLHEWQPPQAGALTRFLEVLFDDDERSDSVQAEAALAAAPEPAPPPEALSESEPQAPAEEQAPPVARVDNEEFDTTPPPGPPEPPPPPRPARDSMSLHKLLKRFGIK
jgi:serine/threonine protein kinase